MGWGGVGGGGWCGYDQLCCPASTILLLRFDLGLGCDNCMSIIISMNAFHNSELLFFQFLQSKEMTTLTNRNEAKLVWPIKQKKV